MMLRFCALHFALGIGLAAQLMSAPMILHVAPNGNDNASGSASAPLATVIAALDKARAASPRDRATILIHGGVHRLAAPIVLTPEDSGVSADKPLTIAAAPNEKPVLSGGIPLKNWKSIGPNLWQADARAQLGPDAIPRSLFINGQRATRARTPNEGSYFRMNGARFNDKPFQFKFHPGQIKPEWAAPGDVEVVAFEKWTDIRQFIRDVNTRSNVVTLSGSSTIHTREDGARYFIENAPDAIDQPGEWRFNQSNGFITLMLKPGENPNAMEIVAPRLQELVQFKGDIAGQRAVRHVVLHGLTFADTDWTIAKDGYRDSQAAVAVRGDLYADAMTECRIESCTFTRLGGYGIDLGRACQRNQIIGNELFDLGAGGVRIGETLIRTNAFDATQSNVISDNHLHHLGRIYPPAVGVLILQSAENRVVHNHIHDLYYTAVSVGWTWGYRPSPCRDNIIEFNHMHHIGLGLLSDMGAVYTLGPQPGTIVRNNLIHDVDSFTYGGWGLYTDEGSSGILLESNIVYHCKSAGFHQHYGRENIIRNNVLAFNREYELMRSRDEAHTSFYFTNNIVALDTGSLLGSTWQNDNFIIDHNIYWDSRAGTNLAKLKFAGATFAKWHARGHDTNSYFIDPLFVDPSHGDFRLQPDSPALDLGFPQLDLSAAGVRSNKPLSTNVQQ